MLSFLFKQPNQLNPSSPYIYTDMLGAGTGAWFLPARMGSLRFVNDYCQSHRMLRYFGTDSSNQTQCRPSIISLHTNSKRQTCYRHHKLIHPRLVSTSPLPTCKPPSRNPRILTTCTLSRLLLNYLHSKFWLHLPSIRFITRGTRYCFDGACPCN